MAHLTVSVEYGIHCLLWLTDAGDTPLSSRDHADLQRISPTFLAKIFTKLAKAEIVRATEGVRGGHALARKFAAAACCSGNRRPAGRRALPEPAGLLLAAPHEAEKAKRGGPGRTRTCNQTVMSGRL